VQPGQRVEDIEELLNQRGVSRHAFLPERRGFSTGVRGGEAAETTGKWDAVMIRSADLAVTGGDRHGTPRVRSWALSARAGRR
jgi:hypothetical protein